jgi:threonine aldolase
MACTPEERRRLRAGCDLILPGFAETTPAQEFREMAAWCELNGIAHDEYGQGALVEDFERKLAALLGKEAAVLMPSGIMAQSVALKVWTEIARLPRFGMHPTSHLALHEEQAHAALLQCHGVLLGDRLRPLTAQDLAASAQPMACVIVELPIREAGGQLPSWDELEALKEAARQRSLPLHMDGARLWECAAFYGRSHAEIAAGFGSVYVSLYKGIGALSGAVLAGGSEFIAQARLWRRRHGGTLYHLSPLVASAAMRFDERLAVMPALYRRTLELASDLASLPAFRVNPALPQTNMLHLYVAAGVETVADARDRIAAEDRCWLFGGLRAAEVPGWCAAEIYVGDRLLHADADRVRRVFARLDNMLALRSRD